MEKELVKLDTEMNTDIKIIKDKYSCLKVNLDKRKREQPALKIKKNNLGSIQKWKILVWNKDISKEKGIDKCYVCDYEIDSKNFECGHIIYVKDNGDTNLDILLPT